MIVQTFAGSEDERLQLFVFLHRLGYSHSGNPNINIWEARFGDYPWIIIDTDKLLFLHTFYGGRIEERCPGPNVSSVVTLDIREFFVVASRLAERWRGPCNT